VCTLGPGEGSSKWSSESGLGPSHCVRSTRRVLLLLLSLALPRASLYSAESCSASTGPKPDSLLHLDDPSPGPSVHTEALIGCYGHPARFPRASLYSAESCSASTPRTTTPSTATWPTPPPPPRTQWLGPKPDSLLHLDDPSPGPSVHTEALIGCYGPSSFSSRSLSLAPRSTQQRAAPHQHPEPPLQAQRSNLAPSAA
jgi:hypothetical protein